MKQIPNLFTLINLIFGSLAVILTLQEGFVNIVYTADGPELFKVPEKIWMAPLFIFLAAAVDFLDGFVARLFNASSPLGKELDSLADVVSFGVAPGMILYQFLRISFLQQENGMDVSIVWLLPALLVPCAAAYRLARFNLDASQENSFKGVPVPAVGILVASLPLIIWYGGKEHIVSVMLNKWFLYGFIILISYLMISRLRLMAFKFKDLSVAGNMPRIILLLLGIASAIFLGWLAIPVIFIFYIVLSLLFKKQIT